MANRNRTPESMHMADPKRHHYLPQFYLRNFTSGDGLLWVYDRQTKQFRQQTTQNSAVAANQYTFLGKDGQRHRREFEAAFSKTEDKAKWVIDKVRAGEASTFDDKVWLSTFVSFLQTRVPKFEKSYYQRNEEILKKIMRHIFSSPQKTEAILEEDAKDLGRPVEPESFFRLIQSNRWGVKTSRESYIRRAIDIGVSCAKEFVKMNWAFFIPQSGARYVTCDNPFVVLTPNDHRPCDPFEVGVLTPGALKLVPLAHDTCLVIGDYGRSCITKRVPDDVVLAYDCFIGVNSDRFIFSGDRPLLEKVVQFMEIL